MKVKVSFVMRNKLLCSSLILVLLASSLLLVPVYSASVFNDGFETGNASAWTGSNVDSVGSTVAVQSGVVHSGSYAAQATLSGAGPVWYAEYYKDLGSQYLTLFCRAYVRFSALPASGDYLEVNPAICTVGLSAALVAAEVYNDAGTMEWVLFYKTNGAASNLVYNATPTPTVDTWYCLEVKFLGASGTGEARLWVNGVEVCAATGLTNDAVQAQDVAVGASSTVALACSVYSDDVVAADAYIPLQYALTVGVSGHGATDATGTSTHDQYSNVTVLATPDSTYLLSYWLLNGSDVGSVNPYTVNMTDNWNLTAVFVLSPFVPLSGWQEDPLYTNAPYVLSSSPSSLYLELDATDTSSKVAIFNLNAPKLSLSSYAYVNATVSGTSNAGIVLRFFMDDGSSFDVVYWQSPATLNATKFDLSPYAGRTLTGLVYVGLMSSDGTTANITITQIAFVPGALPSSVPLSGWEEDPLYTNEVYVLSSSASSLYLELDATSTSSKVAIFNLNAPKLSLSSYAYVNATVTGTGNARIVLRFFMDDGSSFDVVYWQDAATLNATNFDLSPYAGRTLTGLVYVGLMSSDGTTANITITQIAFTHV
jgi:hypothetical protein